MGNYYTGMLFNEKRSLKHFGILGMHWGQRRFQYADGSLTPEGRERYGRSDSTKSKGPSKAKEEIKARKEQEKLATLLTDKAGKTDRMRETNRSIIGRTPQVKYAANRLKEAIKEPVRLRKELDNTFDSFFSPKKQGELYEKYLNKAVDIAYPEYKKYNDDLTRDDVYWGFKYDDWDQGPESSFNLFLKSNEPLAKEYIANEKKYNESYDKVRKMASEYAKEFLGDYASKEATALGPYKNHYAAEKRLTSIIMSEAERLSMSMTDKMAYPRGILFDNFFM